MLLVIKNDAKYQHSDEVLFREVDGEVIIIPPGRGSVSAKQEALFTLTKSGTLIWSLLDGTNTVGQITDHLMQQYDAPEDQVKQDVVAFLEKLAVQGLIKL